MQARDLMTRDVVAVSPETPARNVAKVLLDGRISAVPVVDSEGTVLGILSQGDFLSHRKHQDEKESRHSWWLTLLAEGEPLAQEFLTQLRSHDLTARELMTTPAVTVDESTYDSEIAALLTAHGIKRVPVLRDGKLVGIVSRADLIRAQAGLWKPPGGNPTAS